MHHCTFVFFFQPEKKSRRALGAESKSSISTLTINQHFTINKNPNPKKLQLQANPTDNIPYEEQTINNVPTILLLLRNDNDDDGGEYEQATGEETQTANGELQWTILNSFLP